MNAAQEWTERGIIRAFEARVLARRYVRQGMDPYEAAARATANTVVLFMLGAFICLWAVFGGLPTMGLGLGFLFGPSIPAFVYLLVMFGWDCIAVSAVLACRHYINAPIPAEGPQHMDIKPTLGLMGLWCIGYPFTLFSAGWFLSNWYK